MSIVIITPSATVSAAANPQDNPSMFMVDERQYVDEYGGIVIERSYTSVNPRLRGASGNGRFRNEAKTTYDNKTVTYWVEGEFAWNEDKDTVTVENVRTDQYGLGNLRISNRRINSQSNAGFSLFWGLFRKYAYAEYSFTITTPAGMSRNLSIQVKVHNNGK